MAMGYQVFFFFFCLLFFFDSWGGGGINRRIWCFYWSVKISPTVVLSCSKAGSDVPEMERSWWLLGDLRSLWWSSGDSVCQGQSAQWPSSAHSSSVSSGYCHRSREHSDCSSAYHGTHHTSGHPTHTASLPPAREQKKKNIYIYIL